jgi:hypothetical protein
VGAGSKEQEAGSEKREARSRKQEAEPGFLPCFTLPQYKLTAFPCRIDGGHVEAVPTLHEANAGTGFMM